MNICVFIILIFLNIVCGNLDLVDINGIYILYVINCIFYVFFIFNYFVIELYRIKVEIFFKKYYFYCKVYLRKGFV